MVKRFTDTEKYKDPWFRRLSPCNKMLFIFICDDCNHAGVWKENIDTFNFIFESKATVQDLESMSERIIKINDDTYLIKSFIKFQYGKLNPANKAHLGVIRALAYIGVDYLPYIDETKDLASPSGIGIGTGTGTRAGIGVGKGTQRADYTSEEIPF